MPSFSIELLMGLLGAGGSLAVLAICFHWFGRRVARSTVLPDEQACSCGFEFEDSTLSICPACGTPRGFESDLTGLGLTDDEREQADATLRERYQAPEGYPQQPGTRDPES